MGLSTDLIAQFVKATKDDTAPKKETTVYGTVVKDQNGEMRVQFDGSDTATPVSSTVDLNDGDRVVVMIKNHTATVTGNSSDPAAGNKQVGVVRESVEALGVIVAGKVSTEELEAERAEINELIAKKASIEQLTAARAEIDELIAKKASIEQLEAEKATINELIAKKLSVEDFNAEKATINELIAKRATVDQLTAARAEIDELIAKKVSTETLEAEKATINELIAKKIDAESADIKYAQIDFSNIDMAWMQQFFAKSGIITDIVTDTGTVTGELVGVTIKGDLIEAGTLKADRLVVKGTDGNYYALNTDFDEITDVTPVEEDAIHGSVMIANSITADKISVSDLVAFGATIGGFHIADDAIYSGVKESLDNTTNGLFLDKYGQMALGDSDRYLKFRKASENLIPFPYYQTAVESNGLKFEVLTDGGIKCVGTATAYTSFYLVYEGSSQRKPISAGSYTISVTSTGGSADFIIGVTGVAEYNSSVGSPKSFTVQTDTTFYARLRVNDGVSINATFYPMLNEGSEPLPYEPYGRPSSLEISADMVSFGGTPVNEYVDAEIGGVSSEITHLSNELAAMPNKGRNLLLNTKAFEGPNLSAEHTNGSILTDEKYNELTIRRGDAIVNLLDMSNCVVTANTTMVVGDGTLTVTGYIVQNTISHLIVGKTYTFKANSTSTSERGGGISIECYDSDSAIVYSTYRQGTLNPNVTFTVPKGTVRTRFYFYGGAQGSTTSATYTDVMLNEGSESLPYRPYDPAKVSGADIDLAQFDGIYPEKPGAEYTASFYARGDGELETYFYGADGYLQVASTTSSNGDTAEAVDGRMAVPLTKDWTRHWVTWKLAESKNLIPFPYYDGTIKEVNGITFTVNSDGGIHAVGTATAEANFYVSRNTQFASESVYAMNSPLTVEGKTFYQCQHLSSGTFPVYVRVAAGVTVDKTFYPMINEGSEALPYEPYRGNPSVEKYVLFRAASGNSADVCGAKLEYGTAATDWSEAPEDIEQERANLRSATEQLADDLDAARSEASQAAESLRSDTNQIKQYFQYDKNVGVTIRGSAETSKNLIPFPYKFTTFDEAGLTIRIDAEQRLVVNGSRTSRIERELEAFTLPLGTYTFSASQTSDTTRIRLYKNDTLLRSQAKSDSDYRFTVESITDVYSVRVYTEANVVYTDDIIAPMINEGSEALPYERYVRPTTQYLRLDNDEFKIMDGENVVQHFDAYGNAVIPSLKVETQLDLLGLIFTKDEDGTINCIYRGGNA